ncbi:PAS domain-containing protein [Pontiellaceae bacterium B12227]|nr:PAS domain-containing protein [Pontiellaceae bacterium B12227]
MKQERIDEILDKLSVEDAQEIRDALAEREYTEKKLKEAEERTRLWLENSPACTKILDLDFNLQYMSHAGIAGLGIDDVTDFYGKPYPFSFFPEEAKAKMLANLKKARDTKQIISKEGPVYDIHRNELWFQASIMPICDEQGDVEYLIVVSVETTERKRAEQQLAEEKERLAVTLKSIGDGVITTDTSGQVMMMNSVAEVLTGWTQDAAAGLPLAEVFEIVNAHTAEPVDSPVAKVLENGQIEGLSSHTVLISKNGKRYQIADSGAPIRDRENCIIGVVLVFRDISEEYQMREQLHQSRKMEAIGQLAGGVAHDFNNTLAGISGASELLQSMLPDDKDAKELCGMIHNSISKAAGLTAKLLAFARRQPQAVVVVDLHHVVKDALLLLQKSVDRKIRFESELNAEQSRVLGDPSHIQNAIMNLAINATHAMPAGGTIMFSSRIIDLDEAYCSSSLFDLEPGPFIELTVRDSGIGIAPEDLPRVFEPFFTTKAPGKGTGLGLSTVYGTVQQHSGAIMASSEVGQGSCFRIFLPLTERSVEPQEPEETPLRGCGRILLVDDEPVLLKTTKSILEDLGYTVETAENGLSALTRFKEAPESFDLVLLDMIMPVMSGKECFLEMKKVDPKVCAVLSSGFTQEGDFDEMLQSGLCGFIRKPYRKSELSRVIHHALQPDA